MISIPPSGLSGPVAKKINKLAEVSGSHSTPVQISMIVIPGEAAWARLKEGKAQDENYPDLSTVGAASVYITVYITFPGGLFSNEGSAVCRKTARKKAQLLL